MSKITYGLEKLYYAVVTVGEDGTIAYGAPVRMPGASELSLSPLGEDTPVYADNIKYVTITANQGYDGNVTVYGISETFAKDVLGMTVDKNGVLVESANDTKAQFALLGEFASETKEKKRWVLYNCTAGRTDFAGKTKEESAEAQAFAIPIKASPAEDTGNVKASITGDPGETAAPSALKIWFSSVYIGATEEVE